MPDIPVWKQVGFFEQKSINLIGFAQDAHINYTIHKKTELANAV